MKNIPLNNLRPLDDELLSELTSAIKAVVESGWYVLGDEVKQFEEEFAQFNNAKYCVGVANGTDAIELALRAVGVTSSDQVITVANAGMYSTAAILAIGATPCYADIDCESMTICPNSVKNSIGDNTKAIIVTHLYGQIAAIEALREIADKSGLALIEDCAQSHGAEVSGKKAGTWGDCSAFSFYPTKNLGALGDGGAVITNNSDILEKVKALRQYGWSSKYMANVEGGRNSRLDEMQAAVLRVKLPHLEDMNSRRRKIAEIYSNNITNPLIRLPIANNKAHVFHLYVIRTELRDDLMRYLVSRGVGCEIHYPVLDYQQPIFGVGSQKLVLSNSERVASEILSLPCYPDLNHQDVRSICDRINQWNN